MAFEPKVFGALHFGVGAEGLGSTEGCRGKARSWSGMRCRRAGDPGRIRTCDHKLRRLVLYPAELRGRRAGECGVIASGGAFGNRRLRSSGGLAAHLIVAEI